MPDIGRVLAADMRHDGHFRVPFDGVAGAALPRQIAPRGGIARPLLRQSRLGEAPPAQNKSKCQPHQFPSWEMR
jgi:hypothetical protein